jgi:dTDP-4-dehydrorhamnose reductase
MLRLGGIRPSVDVVADQLATPTAAPDLAAAVQSIALRLATDPAAPCGTFHFANSGAASRAELAEIVMAGAAARGGPSATIRRITTAEWPARARRPLDSRLCVETLTAAYGIAPRPWHAALPEVLDKLVPPLRASGRGRAA